MSELAATPVKDVVTTTLPEETRQTLDGLIGKPIFFPQEFKNWLMDYVAVNIPLIPYGQILGARQNTGRSGVSITASESTASTSYTDLATVGPQLTNIADGTYLIMYGVRCRARASISINGAAASDDDSIWGEEASPAATRMKIVSLSNNNANTVKMVYESGTFSHRWLSIMRLGAP